MAAVKTLEDLFIHALSDVYSAEKQLTKALPKMARAATNPALASAFTNHLKETQGQISRIDQAVQATGLKLKRIKCAAMEGLCEEGAEMIEEVEKGPVLDAGLIAAAQKVEHYEIATYGTLCALAKQLGYTTAGQLLGETLQEEKDTDSKLTLIAEQGGNAAAAQAVPSPAPAPRKAAGKASGKTAAKSTGKSDSKSAAPAPAAKKTTAKAPAPAGKSGSGAANTNGTATSKKAAPAKSGTARSSAGSSARTTAR